MGASIAESSAADGRPRAAGFGLTPGPGGLEGRRALVTGGTRGMGKAVAALLTARDACVVVAGRHVVSGSPVPVIQADLASPEGADLVARQAAEMLGGLHIVVHCVGASFFRPGGALGLGDEDWMQALSTNLLSAVRLDRAVLPGMIQQGSGAIIHISSLQWKRPHESSPAYGPAKAALRSYSKGLATEFGPAGIRVNTVTPGYIATSLAEDRITRIMADTGASRPEAEAALLDAIGGVPSAARAPRRRWPSLSSSSSPAPPPMSPAQSLSSAAATTASCEPGKHIGKWQRSLT